MMHLKVLNKNSDLVYAEKMVMSFSAAHIPEAFRPSDVVGALRFAAKLSEASVAGTRTSPQGDGRFRWQGGSDSSQAL
jgi:hypothetical protein